MLTWLLLAGAVLLAGPVAPARGRVVALARVGRLAEPSTFSWWARVVAFGSTGGVRSVPRPRVRRGAVLAVAAACGMPVAVLVGPGAAVGAAAVGGVACAGVQRAVAVRAVTRQRACALHAIRIVVGELEAGVTTAAALRAAAGTAGAASGAVAAAALAAEHGGDAAAVLDGAGEEFVAVGHAVRIADVTGAPLAGVLRRVADDLGSVAQQRRAVVAELAGPRSSAALLAGLPLLGIVLGASMGADPIGFLLGPGAGQVVCAVGVLLDVAGVVWMSRVLRRAERA